MLGQDFPDYEYIIIDGVSTDNTVLLVKQYGEKIAKFISEPDTGIYDAMNKGIKLAEGQYLLFLNAGDTLLHENVLAIAAKQLAGHKVDVFFGQIVRLNRQTGKATINQQTAYLNKLTLLANQPQHPASFIGRDAFAKVGLYDTTLRICGDYEWFLRAFLRYKCSYRYYDLLCSVFSLGGISTTDGYVHEETKIVREKYYSKFWLFIYAHGFLYWQTCKLSIFGARLLRLFKKI
ncbi:glycosyl transferase group 2 [Candidatus Termititenax persephonae]|uniref:Glycosyl transferase group 2 n=1 Tax=Candidatus Termititenax persephonae TaxID=2218525 RepID=A0A388TER6_9BACT|nr:glycosyl transferase group 2 [Candidatus Termititenax persephonae]